jgi:hypothetical protein
MKAPTTSKSMAGPHSPNCTSRKSKQATILLALYSGRSLNRFEAERLGDHTLPSSISSFVHCHRLTFERHSERVPNNYGSLTTVTRYRLADCSKERAANLLKLWGALQ